VRASGIRMMSTAPSRRRRCPPSPNFLRANLESCQAEASSCSRPGSVRLGLRGLELATRLRRGPTGPRAASGSVDCSARPSGSRGMRLVQSDCVWIDAATAGPLPAFPVPVATEPDARDATSRCQDICEEHSLEQLILLRFKESGS
jgi:hypothetical protein